MDFPQCLLDRTKAYTIVFPKVAVKAYIIVFPKAAVCRCSTKVGNLKNLAKFTGKQLCWSFFVMKFQRLYLY